MRNNDLEFDDVMIGYSALDKWEDAYVYNENACVITDDAQSMKNFLTEAWFAVADHRIDAVKVSDLLKDYGCSSGEYLLEPQALARFVQVARQAGVEYDLEREDQWGAIPEGWGLIKIRQPRVGS
ncbi:MAG: hypothetical protein OES12_05590 [Anaerolineae bacterium]|nr:hypothetical protein [Anaerolineae bacterium]